MATKVMVPLHGELKEDVGLLGAPCFEIPRASLRDKALSNIDAATRQRQLRKKNRFNLLTMAFFLAFNWAFVFALVMMAHSVWLLHGVHGDAVLISAPFVLLLLSVGYLILGERLSAGFKRMDPKICSMYDTYFWGVERYWKFTESMLLVIFKGTPFRNIVSRLAGVRMGKRVFDDGCVFTEKTLVTVGDVFYALSGRSGVVSTTAVDSTHIKAHRSAAGAKGGSSNTRSDDLAADGRPRFTP